MLPRAGSGGLPPTRMGGWVTRVGGSAYTAAMSVVPNPQEPVGLTVLPPDEAVKHARPVPSDAELAIEGLTDEEWKAFEKALTER